MAGETTGRGQCVAGAMPQWLLLHRRVVQHNLPTIHLAVALAPSADAARTKALRGSSTTLTTFPSSMSRLIVSTT